MAENQHNLLVDQFELNLLDYIEPDEEDNYGDNYSFNDFYISPDNQYIALIILRQEHHPTCYSLFEFFIVIKRIHTSEDIFRGQLINSSSRNEILCQFTADSTLFLCECENSIVIFDIINQQQKNVDIDYQELLSCDLNNQLFLSKQYLMIYSIINQKEQFVNLKTQGKLIQGFKNSLIFQLEKKNQFFLYDYQNDRSLLLWKGKRIEKFIVFKNQFVLEISFKDTFRIIFISNKKLLRKSTKDTQSYVNYELNKSIKQIVARLTDKCSLDVCIFDVVKGTQNIYQHLLDKPLQNLYDLKITSKVLVHQVDPGYLIYYI